MDDFEQRVDNFELRVNDSEQRADNSEQRVGDFEQRLNDFECRVDDSEWRLECIITNPLSILQVTPCLGLWPSGALGRGEGQDEGSVSN